MEEGDLLLDVVIVVVAGNCRTEVPATTRLPTNAGRIILLAIYNIDFAIVMGPLSMEGNAIFRGIPRSHTHDSLPGMLLYRGHRDTAIFCKIAIKSRFFRLPQ